MASNPLPEPTPSKPAGLPSSGVYTLAGAALVVGLALGYFVLGPKTTPPAVPARPAAAAATAKMGMPGGHPMPTMEQMKAMADVKAAPLLETLKKNPKDPKVLAQVAALYASTHQFKDAVTYYKKSLDADPKNVTTRTELASSLYYSGDVDGALSELQQALKYKPADVNALFNLGMIRYKGKDDSAGAIAAWQQLLKAHPDLDRKPAVEQLIAEAKQKADVKN
jgi:cytochrome c-type biogenesis protein CcmH/NrfG